MSVTIPLHTLVVVTFVLHTLLRRRVSPSGHSLCSEFANKKKEYRQDKEGAENFAKFLQKICKIFAKILINFRNFHEIFAKFLRNF